VNVKFYKEVFKKLIALLYSVRPEFRDRGSCYRIHANAPAHSSGVVSECLARRDIPGIIPATLFP
jgi:hypothetical protein